MNRRNVEVSWMAWLGVLGLATTLACGDNRAPTSHLAGDSGVGGDSAGPGNDGWGADGDFGSGGDVGLGDETGGDPFLAGDLDGCGPDQVRNPQGVCVDRCHRPRDCQEPTPVCDEVTGLCVEEGPVGPCDPADCAEGWECPAPAEGNECVPIPGWCGWDFDCRLDEWCDDHECVPRVGEVLMTCQDEFDCLAQGGLFLVCELGLCLGCIDNYQCGEGGKCLLGACVTADLGPAGNCINRECADGTRCSLSTGECEVVCQADDQCGPAQECLPLVSRCVEEFGCETSADCRTGQLCLLGLCAGCWSDDDCLDSEACLLGVCYPRLAANPCDDVSCGADELCDALDGRCYPEDGTCRRRDDCRDGQFCNIFGFCTGCTVEGDCRPNQYCLLGTCTPY